MPCCIASGDPSPTSMAGQEVINTQCFLLVGSENEPKTIEYSLFVKGQKADKRINRYLIRENPYYLAACSSLTYE